MNSKFQPSRQTIADSPRRLGLGLCISVLLITALCAVSYWFGGTQAVADTLALISALLVLSGLELVLPTAGPRKSKQRWLLHLQINLINLTVGIPIGAFFGSYLAGMVAKGLGINLWLIDLTSRSRDTFGLVMAGLGAVIFGDFFYYWFHRALHRSNFLWQHHKMHHIDPEFDALTSFRFNWVECKRHAAHSIALAVT